MKPIRWQLMVFRHRRWTNVPRWRLIFLHHDYVVVLKTITRCAWGIPVRLTVKPPSWRSIWIHSLNLFPRPFPGQSWVKASWSLTSARWPSMRKLPSASNSKFRVMQNWGRNIAWRGVCMTRCCAIWPVYYEGARRISDPMIPTTSGCLMKLACSGPDW